jgi:hypothetical protein
VKNPFKIGEKVLTKVAKNEVEAVVTKLWQNEVQVRTSDNEIRWRTMYTVWHPGESPLQRDAAKATAPVVVPNEAQAKNSEAKPATKKASAPRKAGASKSQRRKRR